MVSKQELFVKGKKWFHSLLRIMISLLPAKLLIYTLKVKKSILHKGEEPLHFVAQYGCTKAAKLLIQNSSEVDIKDHNNSTPLHFAAQAGRIKTVRLLLEYGADVKLKSNVNNNTALHFAIKGRKKEILGYLLDKGDDIHAKSKNGFQPIHSAALSGNIDLIKYLTDKGADIRAQCEDGLQPIHSAALSGNINLIKYLTDKGADIHVQDKNGCQPIHSAAQNGHLALVKYLIGKGADIHVQDKNGCQPIHSAAQNGHLALVKYLIGKGVDIHAKSKNGFQPIHSAALSGNIDLIKYLTDKGADIHVQDKNGCQPIHLAAQNGHLALVKYLIGKGVDIHAKSKNGFQPINSAALSGHKELVEFLKTKIGARDESNELFSITKCNNTFNPTDEYCKLFQDKQSNIFNNIISKCISGIALLTDIYKNNAEEKFIKDTASVSDQITKGLCNSFSYLIAFLQLNSKKDFDELYDLMNFDEKELNEENFKKFLEGKLENQKTKEIFELIQTIVEHSPILELGNINNCSNCKEQLPIKYLASYLSDSYCDISSSQIIINRSVVSNILKELKNGDSMLYTTRTINNGHAMSITKTDNGQHIFFDSNMPYVLEFSSEEEVCKVMELASNNYYRQIYDLKPVDYCFPGITLINSTETIKAAVEHYEFEHKAYEHKGKLSSIIWDISVEACNQDIIKKPKVDGVLI